jgi:hypothetical protein
MAKPIFLIEFPSFTTDEQRLDIFNHFTEKLKDYYVIDVVKDIEEINFKFN